MRTIFGEKIRYNHRPPEVPPRGSFVTISKDAKTVPGFVLRYKVLIGRTTGGWYTNNKGEPCYRIKLLHIVEGERPPYCRVGDYRGYHHRYLKVISKEEAIMEML